MASALCCLIAPLVVTALESPWAGVGELYGEHRLTDAGWIWEGDLPWIFHFETVDWYYVYAESTPGAIYGYALSYGGYNFWTAAELGLWHYVLEVGEWAQKDDLPVRALLERSPVQPTVWDRLPDGLRTRYLAVDGSNTADGEEATPWATLAHAVNQSRPGDVIVMRGGVYPVSSTVTIGTSRNGTAIHPVILINHPGEEVILDFSAQSKQSGNIGIRLNGNYWQIIGITIRNAGHNGIRVDGRFNRLERVTAYGNHDTGIHMAGSAAHNLILNCDSYLNFNTTGRVGNNADGFGAKFEALGPGNRFYGCRAWNNSDDGYDFWKARQTIVVENSWAFGNGDGSVFGNPAGFDGGGNGFKLGGDYIPGNHVVIRCVAFNNFGVSRQAKGFDHNNNTGALTLIHNTAYNNGRNYVFPNAPADGARHTFYNNLSVPFNTTVQIPANSVASGNSWQGGIIQPSHFLSIDTALASAPRNPDGSLPFSPLFRPAPNSPVIDAATALENFPFYGSAPDIGAYEWTLR